MNIIVITGQTATGKTSLAVDYAKKTNGELINADSRQIYTYLDIITGKDKEKIKIPIHLYDVVKPNEYFSSFDYKEKALPVIKDIIKRDKTPIIVGGSYLYIKHLLYDVETERISPNWKLRSELRYHSVSNLQRTLKKIDAKIYESLNQSDKHNPQRLIRKIEIASSSPRQPDRLQEDRQNKLRKPFKNILFIGLRFKTKKQTIRSIKLRVENRIQNGAFKEVQKLLALGYLETDPGLKTIGYQQIIKYIKGEYTKEKAVQEWITREIQYSKRQLTFMKKDKNINWKTV